MRITDFPFIAEVKDAYLTLRKEGASRSEATEELKRCYEDELSLATEDDALLFWIGLADAQYDNKEISAEAAENATNALNLLEQNEWHVTPGDIARRKERYRVAPMGERKMGAPRKKFRCTWNVGDTFAYCLSEAQAEENTVVERYVLIRKVADAEFRDGHLFPVVTLALWEKEPFPETKDALSTVPLLRINRGRMAFPQDRYEYRTEIIIKNKKQLKELGLIYLGNFTDMAMPKDEVVVEEPGKMTMTLLSDFEHELAIHIKKSKLYEKEDANV